MTHRSYDKATSTVQVDGEQLVVDLAGDRWISTPCYVCDAAVTHRLERADGIERLPAVCDDCSETPRGVAMLLEAIRFDAARRSPVTARKAYRKPADTVLCLKCGEPTEQHPDGRPRLYCSARCRVAAHRAGKRAEAAKSKLAERLSDDAIERTLARIGRRPHQAAERGHTPAAPAPAPARRIALISCSSEKLGHAAPARELYTSALFRKSVKWAEDVAEVDGWFVLSAKHGLVAPHQVIEPYDQRLTMADRAWGGVVAVALGAEFEFDADELAATEFVVLAGKAYADSLEGHGLRLATPLAGMSIGERLAWLPAL